MATRQSISGTAAARHPQTSSATSSTLKLTITITSTAQNAQIAKIYNSGAPQPPNSQKMPQNTPKCSHSLTATFNNPMHLKTLSSNPMRPKNLTNGHLFDKITLQQPYIANVLIPTSCTPTSSTPPISIATHPKFITHRSPVSANAPHRFPAPFSPKISPTSWTWPVSVVWHLQLIANDVPTSGKDLPHPTKSFIVYTLPVKKFRTHFNSFTSSTILPSHFYIQIFCSFFVFLLLWFYCFTGNEGVAMKKGGHMEYGLHPTPEPCWLSMSGDHQVIIA